MGRRARASQVHALARTATNGARNPRRSSDDVVGTDPVPAIYRRALPHVYGYLLTRCGSAAVAEDLTADTFMAIVAASRRETRQR